MQAELALTASCGLTTVYVGHCRAGHAICDVLQPACDLFAAAYWLAPPLQGIAELTKEVFSLDLTRRAELRRWAAMHPPHPAG